MPYESPVRIVVAHEHAIVRHGLKLLLEQTRNLQVVGEASDGIQAVVVARQVQPDLLLLDLSIPAGVLDALRMLRGSAAAVRTIVLIGREHDPGVTLQLGASGVLAKESPVSLLFKSISAVMRGECWVDERCRPAQPDRVDGIEAPRTNGASNRFKLTKREMQIIAAVADGESNKGIAVRLSVAEDTVKHHLSNVFDKLGVFSRLELAVFAINHGLIQDDRSLTR
jgi:two-component system, NarL family, nitrate/nitrite response regulator NarL